MGRICVFCGSSPGANSIYLDAAVTLGEVLVRNGFGLVYGGAKVGLMGAVADAVLRHKGEVIGVIPKHLADIEVAHQGLTDLKIVGSLHERKAMMADLSDGFVALPGGLGTIEEFCEILTWSQLGLHHKPTGLLNINDYYRPLLDLFDRGVSEKFIQPQARSLVLEDDEPERLITRFRQR